jgi:helix-turn-helix protein
MPVTTTKKSLVKSPSPIVSIDTAMPEPLLLDIKATARALSSTPWTVRNLLWAKKIPFIKIGRRFLIDPADLRLFIDRQKSDQIAA